MKLLCMVRSRSSAAVSAAGAEASRLRIEEDYYLEGSKMVFTADFLRQRGYCCESGCRHCPYGFGPEGLKKRLAEQAAERKA